jgi:hypothetical protein
VVPICVHAQAFATRMHLPLDPFVAGALMHYGITPSQLVAGTGRSGTQGLPAQPKMEAAASKFPTSMRR